MSPSHSFGPSGTLPRRLSPNLLWTGACFPVPLPEWPVHSHFSVYLLKGSKKTVLVDTGYALHWETVLRDVTESLDGRSLDYIFLTHVEFPHAGLITQWMRHFPDTTVVGNVGDLALYYPHLADRMLLVKAGDKLDLGDRDLVFVPAVWRDMPSTLWGFDNVDRTLFVADGFAFLHYHEEGQCDRVLSEQRDPDPKQIKFFNERAMYWTNVLDARKTYADIDLILKKLKPRLIAPAHGCVVDQAEEMSALMKEYLLSDAL